MSEQDWNTGFVKSLAVFLNGQAIPDPDPRGARIADDDFLLLFNAYHEPIEFVVPDRVGPRWKAVADTADPLGFQERTAKGGARFEVEARSVVVMQQD